MLSPRLSPAADKSRKPGRRPNRIAPRCHGPCPATLVIPLRVGIPPVVLLPERSARTSAASSTNAGSHMMRSAVTGIVATPDLMAPPVLRRRECRRRHPGRRYRLDRDIRPHSRDAARRRVPQKGPGSELVLATRNGRRQEGSETPRCPLNRRFRPLRVRFYP